VVSILIPSACQPVGLQGETVFYIAKCVESIRQKSTYPAYEIVLVHSQDLDWGLAQKLDLPYVRRIACPGPFNWSASMNLAAHRATGEHFLFLNDDMEVITPDWIESLLEFSQQPEIGAVGAKLLFPDGRLQHAGVTLLDGKPKHCFYSFPGEHKGYRGSTAVPRNVSAVTGACLMTRAEVFRAVGGFDETFPLDFNDIDYCLRVAEIGWRIVYTPYARLLHYESATKGKLTGDQAEEFKKRWRQKWPRDPYYNPNLSVHSEDYRIAAGAVEAQ
jgi:GT2 family glycosyltransferase